jgi:secreted PhoX family phosphatase
MQGTSLSRHGWLERPGILALGFTAVRHAPNPLLVQAFCDSARTGYGDLVARLHGLFDLPAGFRYRLISRTAERMDDGLVGPGLHDNMTAFPAPAGQALPVRNHEMGNVGAGCRRLAL